ncbi:hypothetical protein SAMN04515674_12370 [Pseudarcicella hirudinis]|uniref:SH3 domain-containing protein n=1 Tax=Pseudarcicella hirudinis TaxID=1079859 RepID=A0A1I5Z285_9BACT|nr:hypothetical protein [Pseudarcicella hirudinis]SFQ50532.1 hypothetical protein SAMN04515674_12370 [Pseudarcicella hirudinis]
MKRYLYFLLGIIPLFSNLCVAQNLKLSDIKGVWRSGKYEDNFRIFYGDSVVSVGLRNNKGINLNFSKIGFLANNDPYLLHLDSIQNKNVEDSVFRYLRINVEDEDIKHLKIKNEESENGIFYFGGILSKLGIDEVPVQVGTRMEIINVNVHIYIKEKDLPPLFIHRLSLKYSEQVLKRILGKSFLKIKIPNAFIYTQPTIVGKTYLLKNDMIEVVKEKEIKGIKWINFRYYGNSEENGKTIEGWIRKTDVE